MSAEVGVAVSTILDRAAVSYIKQNAPDSYDQFVWQVHGAGTVRHYDGSAAYWRRVQTALDSFFTAAQRVEIYRRLLRCTDLARRPESQSFRALALAETRVADLVAEVAQAAHSSGWRAAARSAWGPVDRGCF